MKKLSAVAFVLLGSLFTLTGVFALSPLFFPDVDNSAYYAEALNNMVNKGVISGYDNGNFGPNDAVTRGQLVTILDRYDTDFKNLKAIVCDGGGIDREALAAPYELTYDTLCK